MELGKRIKAKRKAMGLTMEDLAKLVGCSGSLITAFECGVIPVNLNSGAIARVKRILKLRTSRTVPAKAGKKVAKVSTAKPVKTPSESPLLSAISSLMSTVNRLTLAIEAFDRHTRPASNPTGSATASNPVPAGILATNSLDPKPIDRRYPWANSPAKQA